MTAKQKEAPVDVATEAASQRVGAEKHGKSTTKGREGQAWTMPTDPAERNRLILQGICPICGGKWGSTEGHRSDCPNGKPAKRNGAGKDWRLGRGRQRRSSRAERQHPLDAAGGGR